MTPETVEKPPRAHQILKQAREEAESRGVEAPPHKIPRALADALDRAARYDEDRQREREKKNSFILEAAKQRWWRDRWERKAETLQAVLRLRTWILAGLIPAAAIVGVALEHYIGVVP